MAYGLSACCLLLLLLAGFAAPVPGFLTEGSRCWVAVSASAGTCSKDRDCLEALTAIWDNRPRPSHCGFDGSHEIVCCPDHENGHLGPPYTSPSVAACRHYLTYYTKRIISGTPVCPLEFPHMAALGYKSLGMEGISWLCGGTLISDQFVLTAAHCCKTTLVQVRLGAIDLSSPEVESDLYGISEIIVYPGYSRDSYNSDIALLKLDRRVEFNLSVFPACLDRQHADPPSFIAAGWGSTNPNEGSPCWDAVSASAGTCLKAHHCQGALAAIRDYRPLPSHCGFVGFDEIVCCTDGHNDGTQRDDSLPDHDGDRDNEIPDQNGHLGPTYKSAEVVDILDQPVVAACIDYENDDILRLRFLLSGQPVRRLELPHMAALGYKLPGTEGVSWLCGGTLISDQFVLTAAHCCSKRLVQVRLGAIDLSSPGREYDLYGISEIIVHPGYSRRSYHSDIALLKLDRTVKFRLAVFPACLNTRHSDPPSFTAAGWGATNPGGTRFSSSLMKTTIYPFQLSECINFYKEKFPKENPSSVICAGDPEGKADTCGGDSGGPIVVGEAAPYTVVGITSRGPSPCGGKVPSIYTRVSDYIDWIEDHVWPSHD